MTRSTTPALNIAFLALMGAVSVSSVLFAQTAAGDVTYSKDVAPILQRSCENCHRPGGGAPMSRRTYEEVRPWARAIKQRTGIGPHAGVMPPWYMEKNIGIQKYKDDIRSQADDGGLLGWDELTVIVTR